MERNGVNEAAKINGADSWARLNQGLVKSKSGGFLDQISLCELERIRLGSGMGQVLS